MKYTTEEAMMEILARSGKITERRNSRQQIALSCAAGILGIALIAVIAALPGGATAGLHASAYGALMAGQEKGGYVLTALIAFVLGVTVTLLCLRFKKRRTGNETDEDTVM